MATITPMIILSSILIVLTTPLIIFDEKVVTASCSLGTIDVKYQSSKLPKYQIIISEMSLLSNIKLLIHVLH